MSVITHCLPNQTLGTDELPVSSISAANTHILTPSGSKRGVVVNLHGLIVAQQHNPRPMITDSGGFLPVYNLTFSNNLVADGWVVMHPSYPEDNYVGIPSRGVFNDIVADPGHGARYLETTLHWWEHLVEYIHTNYGNWPIVLFGFSWGGWHVFQLVNHRPADITAYITHHGATVLSEASPVWTNPVDFTAIDTSGLDISSTFLNSATSIPGMIGWGESDSAIGYTNIQTIYNNALGAGCPVSSNGLNEEHILSMSDVTTYTNWITGTVDPLAPAIY